MAESETNSSPRQCPQCGAELPPGLPPELCPRCLLKTGLGTQPHLGPNGTAVLAAAPTRSRGLPKPGEQLGHYRIVRTLGEGGMGAVFEADDLDSGRCVALKVLSHTLDSPEARERFFREGRLAASINHPNSVYVFGTEAIAGTPVIAMELVAGGTLQDRVTARGPLLVGEAVDAVLQIIAGLEAAQRIGILHRDVKPSNCFRDADGTVKIGDFGLSISTGVRTEPALTATGAFLGTPAFCSPEQLRGDELNVRSDMYAVGATLFYLLTGRTPFEGKNHVQLLATVLEQRAPSPKQFRRDLPKGLARVILRCLEKQPGERFKNYAELAQALAPYSSAAPTPATLGLRFVAGVVDAIVLGALGAAIFLLTWGTPLKFFELAGQPSAAMFGLMLTGLIASLLYYGLLENRFGATVGKALCRLRVVGPDNSPPALPRALLRAAIYMVVPVLPYWFAYALNPAMGFPTMGGQSVWGQQLLGFSYYLMLALLFCTARRRNGFAAIQDLFSRTRVIARAALESRPALPVGESPPPPVDTAPVLGPYHVLETLDASVEAQWLLGYDLRLLRKVWLRVVPPGTPPVTATLRNLSRVGRLRWLTGRRSATENWDAFEALDGKPLVNLIQTAQPWAQVRYWLHDLAMEISAAEKDGSLPAMLALERVWITRDGRAKLLDFPAPGVADSLSPAASDAGRSGASAERRDITPEKPAVLCQHAATQGARLFLDQVAATALTGNASAKSAREVVMPFALHARDFLNRLTEIPDAGAIAKALKPLLSRVATVSRWRRAAVVAGCVAFPLIASVGMVFALTVIEQFNRSHPGMMELQMLLQRRSALNSRWVRNQPHPTDRQYAVYIAQHYRGVITNRATWSSVFAAAMIQGELRRFAEQSVVEHPAPTAEEIADAEAALKGHLPPADGLRVLRQPWLPLVAGAGALGIYVGLPALLAALLFRGGLVLRIANVTFVRRDGQRASRLRVFWRAVVAWCPLLLAVALASGLKPVIGLIPAALISALLLGGLTILSLALPKRGLPDSFAGTWPVPR